MGLPAIAPRMSRAEFLDWVEKEAGKHEYWRGEVFAMTGARQAHVIVSLNVATLLKSHLRGSGCRAFIADMAVEIEAADAIVYPDVVVSCEPADLAAERTLRSPRVIVEVLSESTAAYDRGEKFASYRSLASLQEFVLIDIDRQSVEIFRRTPENEWLLATNDGARGLILRSLDFAAGLDAVFEDVGLASPPPDTH